MKKVWCLNCHSEIKFDEMTNTWFHPDPEAMNAMRWDCNLRATPPMSEAQRSSK